MHIENNLDKCVTCVTNVTLLSRLRQRRTGKSDDIQCGCADYARTEHQVAEEVMRHSVASLTDGQPTEREIHPGQPEAQTHADAAKKPAPYRADDLAHGKPCTTSDAELAALRERFPHLCVCPATSTPWNFRYVSDCATKCKTPCERQIINTISGVVQ